MVSGLATLTKDGNTKKSDLSLMYERVQLAWNDLQREMVECSCLRVREDSKIEDDDCVLTFM